MNIVDAKAAQALLAGGDVDLVDVREPREWATGHLPTARLVPLETLRASPRTTLPRDRVLFVCAKGGRSQTAAKIAEAHGLVDVYSLDGGTEGWAARGLPIEMPPPPASLPPPAAARSSEPVSPADEADERLPELDAVIAQNLRELRTQRGLTLDATARLTGLSRTLLGQIELGLNTPSVGVVWKIARAFDVPFAGLLAAPRSFATTVLRRATAKRLVSPDGRFSSRALFPFGEANKVELYELTLAGHAREDAEAHRAGTRENLVVVTGRLELLVGTQRFELERGDAILFAADVAHAYVNPGNEECLMHLVMTYV
jgi:rhodanese-related sulfurtransferase/transcriptional regulator with XRE-family HTH domain